MERKGFTLIELLVVIGIIAVITGISAAGYWRFVGRAQNVRCSELVHQTKTAIETIYQKTDAWPRLFLSSAQSGDGKLDARTAAALAKEGVMSLSYRREERSDGTYNYISKVRRMIKDIENYDLYLNGRKVNNDETLDGYGEYYSRSRVKLSKLPTLYFSQAKDTDMKMRIYDKARELNESSPQKTERLKTWLGWEDMSNVYRVEVTLHNTNVRDFMERFGERLYRESGEHSNVLNLLGMSDFRLAMFLDSVDRLIYFRNKKTREKISLVEVCSGI